MLRSGYQSARLFSIGHFNDITSPSTCLDDTDTTLVSAVWHAFVYAGIDPDRDSVSWVVDFEETAKTNFPSLARFLSEESSGS